MPFTFSHPIFAFPIKYISPKRISLTGLLLGSMSPDFEYFIMLEPYSRIGHSILGLILQAIPLSLLFAFIFHRFIKEQLAVHAPSAFGLNERIYSFIGEWKLKNKNDWMFFLISTTIGFFIHIGIDAFTHIQGYFVVHYTIFHKIIIFALPLYKVLQYSLSIIGLFITLVFMIYHLLHSNPITSKKLKISTIQKYLFWFSSILCSVVITFLKILLTSSENTVGILVVAPISGLFLGVFITSLVASRSLCVSK